MEDAPRLLTEAEAFATLSEAVALAALAGVAAEGAAEPGVFDPLALWLEDTADAPLARIRDGFRLTEAATALIVVLHATARSEAVARAVAGLATGDDRLPASALPLWLARRVVPGLGAELASGGALRRFGFIGPLAGIADALHLSPAVADRLSGLPVSDPALAGWVAPLTLPDQPSDLAALFRQALAVRGASGLPPVLTTGPDLRPEDAARALSALGLSPWLAFLADLPIDPAMRETAAAIWSREAALEGAALIVDASRADPAALASFAAFADRVMGQVVLCNAAAAPPVQRGLYPIVPPGDAPARALSRWVASLGQARAARVGAGLSRVAAQFRLDPEGMAAATLAAGPAIDAAPTEARAEAALWHAAARATAPADLPGVGVTEPGQTWDDLILPAATEATLRRIETHVRHAARIFDDWGFAARMGGAGSWRGRGVAALFAGPSGTGKTMAANVLAASLDLRVMVLDLSQIISKYIGDTAKNVAAAFAEAERLGAVMVWNEGDAIWGARGGVSTATDRHVNAEVGDLLQRIEAFSGFTIVTTNLRHAIDPAFLRRFRFIVDFPLPSAADRLRLWSNAFPPAVPVEPLDWRALAGLPVTGGAIRNVALAAAFRAAGAGTPVSRAMIEAELAEELRKQNLPVPHIDWSRPAEVPT